MVLYGYQGADREAEKLALTDQLLDAAFGEQGVFAREQPCLVVGDFNVEPTKIPCLAKGMGSGLTLKLLGLLLLVGSLGLPVSAHGTLLVGPEGIFSWAALVLLLRFLGAWFREVGGFFLTWLYVRTLSILGGFLGSLCLFNARLFGLLLGCLLLIRVGV